MCVGAVVGGKYRIERLVAEGSMAAVYEASHVGIGKRVAIKLMAARYASSDEAIARFRREARAAGALDSSFIVQIFDAGCDDALGLYLVTELLVGEDLEARIAREGSLDAATAAAIGYEVARGLAKAHAAGVIHRDLKPANIFLAERDDGDIVAKILDFGISKTTLGELAAPSEREGEPIDDSSITAIGCAVGTPQYMSPEQARADADLDERSDLWSLGATLFEALAGRPPHEYDGSPFDLMCRIVREDAPLLAEIAPWVPDRLCDVVDWALVRDRDARIPDAATFARELSFAVPNARASLSGVQLVAAPACSAPATIPAPPALREREDEPPESDDSRVEVFLRADIRRLLAAK